MNNTRAATLSHAPVARGRRYSRVMREPLLHFVLLGALLFAVDHFMAGSGDDPNTIHVDDAVDNEARRVFKTARGREPGEEELYALRRVWLDNEVLYREGLALGVDKGDPMIRERVIFKALSVVNASLTLPPVDDETLRQWFARHQTKYDEPARFTFQEAVLEGDRTEVGARAFAAALNAGAPGDVRAGLRIFRGRPHDNLVQSYGPEFTKALEMSHMGEWRALAARDGWRVVRIDSMTTSKPASFEALRGVVLQDWTDATMAEQRTAAVRALARKYKVIADGETK